MMTRILNAEAHARTIRSLRRGNRRRGNAMTQTATSDELLLISSKVGHIDNVYRALTLGADANAVDVRISLHIFCTIFVNTH